MRKTLASLLVLFTAVAWAEDKGGFVQEGQPPAPQDQRDGYRGIRDVQHQTMSNELATLPDKTRVSLQGNIVQKKGASQYLLRDEKGSVMLDIQDSVWQGQEVKPDELVSLSGRLIHKGDKMHIQVDKLRRH